MAATIIIAVLLIGIGIYAAYIRRNPYDQLPASKKSGNCDLQCGTCSTVGSTAVRTNRAKVEPNMFNDEELDTYSRMSAESYSQADIAQFEQVLRTLRPSDITPWMCDLRRRRIAFPPSLTGLVRKRIETALKESNKEK